MKNVTPKVGQVWANLPLKFKIRAISLPSILSTDGETTTVDGLHGGYKFVPQSDLERLAVNEPEWFHSDCNWVRRDNNGGAMYTDMPAHPSNIRHTYYTRKQWQNMRYELGLDERPKHGISEMIKKRKIHLGIAPHPPINMNCPCVVTRLMNPVTGYDDALKLAQEIYEGHNKKETKMIDLNHCKIDDKFVTARGLVMTVFAFGHNSVVMRDEEGQFNVFDIDSGCVITFKTGPQYDIVSKHDPRPWLKDLPDAGLFEDGWLAIHADEGWYWFEKEPVISNNEYYHTNGMFVLVPIMGIKMPKLTDDEWRDSKISIPDLKAWQEQNK